MSDNRIIKFRAWNPLDKQIYYPDRNLQVWELLRGYSDENLMQFTGLLDKNGKEIYEGDIVGERTLTDSPRLGVVKFGEYANPFNSDEFTKHQGFYVDWNCDMTRRDLGFWTGHKLDFEVIGNIYENPELLNSTKGEE